MSRRVLIGRIQRVVLGEVLLAWLAISVVLILVLLTNRLVQFLADAASGDVPPGAVLTLLGLKALANLGTLLPASYFLGVILAFGRLQRDGELTAMAASGLGPVRLYTALYALAVPLALAVAAGSFVLSPWAERAADSVAAAASRDLSLGGLATGRFTPLAGRGVVYLEGFNKAGDATGVFAWLRGPSGNHVVVAKRASWQIDPQSQVRHLVLESGHRYDLPNADRPWSVIRFGEHGIRVPRADAAPGTPARDARATRALWQSAGREDRAELQWRLALPITALSLTVLALPLAQSRAGPGRYARVVLAVLVYLAYFNGLKAAQDAVEDGLLHPAVGLWPVHAGVLALGGLLLAAQLGGLQPRALRSSR